MKERSGYRVFFSSLSEKYRKEDFVQKYDSEIVAQYYGETLTFIRRVFVFEIGEKKSMREIQQIILDFMGHTFFDFVRSDVAQ